MRPNAKLSSRERRLIICNCLNAAAGAFGSYFISKWTIELDDGISTLILQYCIQIVPQMLFYFLGIKLAQKIPISVVLGIGFIVALAAYSSFFVLVQVSGTGVANYVYGFLVGAFSGLYWSASNNISIEVTKKEGRSKFLTLNMAGNQISSIAAPLIMLIVVLSFKAKANIPFAVYVVFLSILIALYAASAVLAFMMRANKYDKKLELKKCFFTRENKTWNTMLLFCFTFGLMGGVPAAIGGIYIVAFSGYSPSVYLAYLLGSIVVNCLAGYVFSTIFAKVNKVVYYFVCTVIHSVTILATALTYDLKFAVAVVLACVLFRSFSSIHKSQIESIQHMNIIADNSENNNISGKYLAREVFVVFGRAVMAFAFALVGMFIEEKTAIILFVGIGCFLIAIPHGILFLKLKNTVAPQAAEVLETQATIPSESEPAAETQTVTNDSIAETTAV